MSSAEVTKTLARWAAETTSAQIPPHVRREGVRTFVNWLGCAVGGARHETVERALQGLARFSGPPRATIIGRTERLDELHAALINGISSHVLDFDDTHLKTIIHPAGPVASAILAMAKGQDVSGADLLSALIVGIEVECSIGNSVYPDHYHRSWHITGTAGVFGAAAAAGRLRGLDASRMTYALGIAATQSSGLREMFGTMCKSFHPGRAAQNGAASAYLAEAGFDSSVRAIEAPRGFANVLSTKQVYSEILDGLGARWESALNTYKPFACGIVIHPVIDGCSQIHRAEAPRADDIVSVDLRVHPLVLELTGKLTPRTGLEGKFSVYHSAAYALLHADGTPTAFTDEAVRDPEVIALRGRVNARAETGIREASAKITVTLKDGRRIERDIAHAVGSLERPLSDADIDEKFLRQASPILGERAATRLLAMAWALDNEPSAAAIARAGAHHP